MEKEYVIRLSAFDLGQLIDGLDVRARAWRNTASYLRTGEAPSWDFVAEECSDAEEATRLADHYDRIIRSLLQQKAEQDRR